MRPPDKERGPGDHGPDLESTTIPIAYQSNRHHRTRFAEDAAIQLTEALAFLEAADMLACGALVNGDDLVGALEGVIVLHGRVRSFLDRVLVREAVAA